MGLFNSLHSQYERLNHAMDDQKTFSLGAAAAVMRVRRERVDAQLVRMHKKGYFGADKPYVDDQLEMVVRDRRYANLAALLDAAAKLLRALDEAQQTLRRVSRVTPQQLNSERARAVGNFVRDVVDGAMSKRGAGAVLRNKTGELMRDLIAPDAPVEDYGSVAQSLALLNSSAAGVRDFALAHSEAHYDTELSAYLLSACRQVEAWNSCGVSGRRGRDNAPDQALLSLEARLRDEFVPGMMRRLDELHGAAVRGATVNKVYDDPMLKEVHRQCADLRALSRQPKSSVVRDAMTRVNAILDDIQNQLYNVPESREQAGVRSLRVVYLPMVQELLEKYIRYEGRSSGDETVQHVLRDTEKALTSELPTALMNLLRDLRMEDAIDLEAQTAALRQKMQLDGLLKDE